MEPLRKQLSRWNFFNYLYTIYIYTNHNQISGKKYRIHVRFQNGGQIPDFHFASFRFRPKFDKPLSPKDFFNEMMAQIRRS